MPVSNLKHFYIPEEQSIYLLSHADAQKLKDWINLCIAQLEKLGFRQIELIGKGAYGFAFGGTSPDNEALVFKFSRANLPQHVQDRLEEEAFMLGNVEHPLVPGLVEFLQVGKQAILVMQRAQGVDLEQLSLQKGPLEPRLVVKIAVQLTDILNTLRNHTINEQKKPIVHGDIKPSNIVFNPETEEIGLIDWGSSVFAQMDSQGQYIANNVMDLMSGDLHQTNARLGDVYFIGDEQLNGGLSTPRFDEQGVASTLYALASGQSCRFGTKVITPRSLGLPVMLAEVLTGLLSEDMRTRQQAGDYLINNAHYMKNMVFADYVQPTVKRLIPARHHAEYKEIETVVYSSRKSFLRAENYHAELRYINDAQFERYYKNYMQGMGETEKAFVSEVARLGRFPVVGGIAVRWEPSGVYIDSSLNLYDHTLKYSFDTVLNNVVNLARAIHRVGIFKSCMFNAKDTLHLERTDINQPFIARDTMKIPYEVSFDATLDNDESRMHSYFEDGDDPDELLKLPDAILAIIRELNLIHHTGCIIFESLELHMKIHSYYKLLDPKKEADFRSCLQRLVKLIPEIEGVGISGFMKLPYKDTRFFEHHDHLPERFYPRNPKQV
ncbi:protein kinase domain-containing protein [Alteromonas sp. a30]|uniref:protein kinase domain-containing protein n=1 Tax=Alteromonas sp. a30 TaxID=2730917 RepID=UPI002280C5A5|nr:phosphotransferase [Alteromonas sp. a30]MCY7294128.1 phosphotransferase [Alteromonas sp. a30]